MDSTETVTAQIRVSFGCAGMPLSDKNPITSRWVHARLTRFMKTMRFHTQLILGFLFTSLVGALIANSIIMYLDYRHQQTNIHREIEAVKSQTLPFLSAAAWELDQVQCQRLANSLYALPNIRHVSIQASGIATINLGTLTPTNSVPTFHFELRHNTVNPSAPLGSLTVQLEAEQLKHQLLHKGFILATAALIQMLLVAVVIRHFLQKGYLQPLRKTTRAIQSAIRPQNPQKSTEPETLSSGIDAWDTIDSGIVTLQKQWSQEKAQLELANRKFSALALNNPEMIWCCDLAKPIDLESPENEQVHQIYQHGILGELNTAILHSLGLDSIAQTPHLKDLPFIDEPLFTTLVNQQYRVKDKVTQFQDMQGNTRYFRNSLTCWIEDNTLHSIWGITTDITQSLTTQKALEEREQQLYLSQARLTEAQALAHMGHWSYFTETEKLQVSDEFARIYGFDPDADDIQWRHLIERIHPEDRSYIIHTLSDPRTQAAGAEHRIVWKNGETRFVQAITRKHIVNNIVESTFGILIDITDRRRAEDERSKSQRALVESEARLAQAQAIAHMGHWLLDCKTQKLLCSDEFYRLLGHPPQQRQFDQQAFVQHVHPDDHALVEHLLISAREKSFTNEFRIIRLDEEHRFMRGTFTPFYAGGKTTPRIFGIMMDVTEQKQIEIQLRASQELFATAFDSSPDGIFLLNQKDKRLIKVNQALTQMLSVDEQTLLGKTLDNIPLYLEQANPPCIAQYIDAQSSTTNIEVILKVSNDTHIYGLLSWRHVVIAQKPSVLAIIHDVSPLRTLQKTADVQQKQLIQADKLASIGTMVAGVAHEINNPNHLIQMNAELLEGFCLPILGLLKQHPDLSANQSVNGLPLEEVRDTIPELLQDIRMSSQRINRIVNDLKDFARPQENSEYTATCFNDVVIKTLHLLSTLIEKNDTRILTALSEVLPPIWGDAQRLEQVLVNLIMNAIESSPTAGSEINLSTFLSSDEKCVVCEIEDSGCGIPEEDLSRIFDPFFTTKQEQGGTGLGLAISYRLIQEHGGHMSARQNTKHGTTLRIQLPALERTENTEA